jgi:aminoglycoside/choline kinase family phosphotransferase
MTRAAEIDAFLSRVGWAHAAREPLLGDASTRRYIRLAHGANTAMLMDQPQGAETKACPPNASQAERMASGYNAVARLAGPDTGQFAGVAQRLLDMGLSAPRILAQDYPAGLLLIEDLGEARFADIILDGAPELPLYEAAIDTLAALHRHPAPDILPVPGAAQTHLLAYDTLAMRAEVALLTEWFFLAATGKPVQELAGREYLALWDDLLGKVRIGQPVMTLRDYHAENLMWLPERLGVARVGLLDFQDALAGPAAYDVISLLEDARRDVSPELAEAMMRRYERQRQDADARFDAGRFREEAAILSAQRNCKIIGIFARLWRRDSKPRYLAYLPRMWRYLQSDLAHPALSPIRGWFDTHVPQEWRGQLAQM